MSTELTVKQLNMPNVFVNDVIKQTTSLGELMAAGKSTVPDHLQGSPSDCTAIAMQAYQWGMNPFAVAQKTHLINGALAYEAQLVNAVVSSSTAIRGRFHYEYSKGWERLAEKVSIKKVQKTGRNGAYMVDQTSADWTKEDESGLWVRVGAVLRGEEAIQWGEKLYLSQVLTRNSPLWATKPEQQIGYLAVKYWARLYCPAVILGVYTSDELPEADNVRPIDSAINKREPKDVAGQRVDEKKAAPKAAEPACESKPEPKPDATSETDSPESTNEAQQKLLAALLRQIGASETLGDLDELQQYATQLNPSSNEFSVAAKAWKARKKELLASQTTASAEGLFEGE